MKSLLQKLMLGLLAAACSGACGAGKSASEGDPETGVPKEPAANDTEIMTTIDAAVSTADASRGAAQSDAGRSAVDASQPTTGSAPSLDSSVASADKPTTAPVQDVACDPKDQTPPAQPVDYSMYTTKPPTGPYKVSVESDPSLSGYIIYRPEGGAELQAKLPIVTWGNGGCLKAGLLYAAYNMQVASHGYLVIADGDESWSDGTGNASGNQNLEADGTALVKAVDWALKENDRPCSKLYHKLATTKIAANGTSCGGLMSLGAASDPRMTTVLAWNSGLFSRDQKVYDSFHTPLLYVNGGSTDISTPNAEADFNAYQGKVPLIWGVEERQEWIDAGGVTGHIYSFFDDNGGEAAKVGLAWFNWHLRGDESAAAKGMFAGKDCGLCMDSHWTLHKKNID